MAVHSPELFNTLLLCCLGLFFLPEAQLDSKELYVKPTEDTTCPEPCHTLDEYVQNETKYFLSETIFNFLPGNHTLSHTPFQSLNVSGITNLFLVATTSSGNGRVNINCTDAFVVSFEEITNLTLQGLTLSWCHALAFSNVVNLNLFQIYLKSVAMLEFTNVLGTSNIIELFVFHVMFLSVECHNSPIWPSLTVENSSLSYSVGTVLRIFNHSNSFILKNVTFSYLQAHSQLYSGEPTDFAGGLIDIEQSRNVSFTGCTFTSNVARGSVVFLEGSVVMLASSLGITFTDCVFSDISGTSITAIDSTFILSGSNTFSNSTAYKGGAVAFYGHSYVVLSNDSNTRFVNNSAQTAGGAIYIDRNVIADPLCFFILEEDLTCEDYRPNTHHPIPPLTLWFDTNMAGNGGHELYGASLDTCLVNTGESKCSGWNFANSLFQIKEKNSSDLSPITSDPLRVCLCDNEGTPSCTKVFKNLTALPGEPFSILAVVVGDRFGTVDGSVYAHLLPLENTGKVARLDNLEQSQRVEHASCTNLSYTILTNSSEVVLVLTASGVVTREYPSDGAVREVHHYASDFERTGYIAPLFRSFPVFINITVLPCPLGFMLLGDPPQCICDIRLKENHISCNLTMQTIQRSGTKWVNASFHQNTSNGVIVNKNCPNNYCKSETLDISLENPETQCAFNHSGILCGGCQSGHSRALSSERCLECSDDFLAIIPLFALAGLVLVFFIKVLNLTVAEGTINGLILYTNIVWANKDVWLSSETNIFTAFIAWLNLDLQLDIQTCLVNGLDAYWKTWFQFIFPLYIWTIAAVIIILSHYSSIAARIFGKNSVPALATLFLLSYSKLLRTVILVFEYSIVDYPDGTSAIVWSYDGNLSYFSAKRLPLLLIAIAVLLFLWLPYTMLLLFAQCLQKSNTRVATILVKLKPFFDAYFGPLKDNHRYWIGLLLLVRSVLFVVYAATPTSMTSIDLLATTTVIVCLLVYPYTGWVNKTITLNILENAALLNLVFLSMGTYHIRISGGSQIGLASTSAGIAFAQFVAIVILHVITMLKKTRCIKRLVRSHSKHAEPNSQEYERLPDDPEVNREGAVQLRVTLDDFREPVLKYVD